MLESTHQAVHDTFRDFGSPSALVEQVTFMLRNVYLAQLEREGCILRGALNEVRQIALEIIYPLSAAVVPKATSCSLPQARSQEAPATSAAVHGTKSLAAVTQVTSEPEVDQCGAEEIRGHSGSGLNTKREALGDSMQDPEIARKRMRQASPVTHTSHSLSAGGRTGSLRARPDDMAARTPSDRLADFASVHGGALSPEQSESGCGPKTTHTLSHCMVEGSAVRQTTRGSRHCPPAPLVSPAPTDQSQEEENATEQCKDVQPSTDWAIGLRYARFHASASDPTHLSIQR